MADPVDMVDRRIPKVQPMAVPVMPPMSYMWPMQERYEADPTMKEIFKLLTQYKPEPIVPDTDLYRQKKPDKLGGPVGMAR